MEHTPNFEQLNEQLKKDPRIQSMDPKRLSLLIGTAEKLSNTPNNQKMNQLLTLLQTTSQEHISFSKEEQEIIYTILTEKMSPEEKNKMELIRTLSMKFKTKNT